MRTIQPLTPRELDCLDQAAQDKTVRETAEALCISLDTVKKHRAVILGKLGCQTMAGALMVAVQQGWILKPFNMTKCSLYKILLKKQ